MAVLSTSPWRRAPWLIWRQPAVVAAVIGGVLVLAAAAAATPLFLSSSRSAVQERQVDGRCRADLGITLPLVGDRAATDRIIRDIAKDVEGLNAPVATTAVVTYATRAGVAEDEAVRSGVRVMLRDGALDHVEKVGASPTGGDLWLDDLLAAQLEVGPGEPVVLGEGALPVVVAGVYRSLRPRLETDPFEPYWCGERTNIVPQGYGDDPPPPLAFVADQEAYDRVFSRIGPGLPLEPERRWLIAPDDDVKRLDRAEAVLDRMMAVDRRIRNDVPADAEGLSDRYRERFREGRSPTELGFLVERSQAVAGSVGGSIGPVTIAALVTAMSLVAAAGSYWVDRRRDELTMLGGRGVGPSAVGAKAGLELLGPALIGGVAGFVLALVVVRWLGPSPELEPAAVRAAARNAGLASFAAIAVLGVTAALRARRLGDERHHRFRRAVALVPWELAPLAAAAAAYDRAGLKGVPVARGVEVAQVDVLALAFPLLFIVGVVAAVARLAGIGLRVLRRRGRRLPTPAYLAVRRLAGAPLLVVILMAASATAIGTLAYSAELTTSLDATLVAKSRVSVGSDVAASIIGDARVPEAIADRTTAVVRLEESQMSFPQVEVIAVDPDTFSRGGAWDPSYADRPLDDLLDRLRDPGDGKVRALVVNGGLPSGSTIDFAPANKPDLELDAFAGASTFPGVGSGPLVVVDRAALERLGLKGATEHWTRGDPQEIVDAYGDTSIRYLKRRDLVVDSSSFASVRWTFDYLRALGFMLALIGVGGLLLYLDTRQRERAVAYAFLRRMGLSRLGHFRSILMEVTGTLAAGYLVGTVLAAIAGRLILARIDPVPSLAPSPLVRYPLPAFAAAGLATLLVCGCGAWMAQRSADRARSAEVLRLEV